MPAAPSALAAEVQLQRPAGSWGRVLSGLSVPQTQSLSKNLNLDLSNPSIRKAFIHVMSAAPEAPSSDMAAPAIAAYIERSAADTVRQVDQITAALATGGPATISLTLSSDLAALHQLKGALDQKTQQHLKDSLAAFKRQKVQATIAASKSWGDKPSQGVDDAPAGSPGQKTAAALARFDPSKPVSARAAFGARTPPTLPNALPIADNQPLSWSQRLSGLFQSGLRSALDWVSSDDHGSTSVPDADISLGDMVSFLRAVSTLPPEQAKAYRDQYAGWFKDKNKLSQARRALRRKESLTPARLDTTIYHQAGDKEDALVELVSNGADTLLEKAGLNFLVGRFGVGGFQVFQELEGPGDRVILETATKDGQVLRLTFWVAQKADPSRIGDQIKVAFESLADSSFGVGTKIQVLKAGGLSAQRQQALKAKLISKLDRSSRARVSVNGDIINTLEGFKDIEGHAPAHAIEAVVHVTVNAGGYEVRDHGLGMNEGLLFDKFLLPRHGTKAGKPQKVDEALARRQTQFFYRGNPQGQPGGPAKMAVSLRVAGVAVERFEVAGLRLPEEVFLELPSGSWLPESRNKIEVTPAVWAGLKGLVEKALAGDLEKNAGLLNALAAIAGYLENPRNHPETAASGDNFNRYLSERLDLIPGLKKIDQFQGRGNRAYTMRLKSKDRVFLQYGSNLIFDEDIYARYKDYPLLLNLLMNFHIGYGDKKPAKGLFTVKEKSPEGTTAPAAAAPKDELTREISKALGKPAWFETLDETRQKAIRRHLAALLKKLPEHEREAVLAAELARLRVIADFARSYAPEADWTAWFTKVTNSVYFNQESHLISNLAQINGKAAFSARTTDGQSQVFIGGEAVWSGEGYAFAPVEFDDGWAVVVIGRKKNENDVDRYHLIVNGKLEWSGTSKIHGLVSIGGKPAFYLERDNGVDVYVGGVLAKRFDGIKPGAVVDFIGVGDKWAMRIRHDKGTSVYLGSELLWSEYGNDTTSKLINKNGALVFLARDSDGLQRLFVNGRPTGEGFSLVSKQPVIIGGDIGFVAKRNGVFSMMIGGHPVWTGTKATTVFGSVNIAVSGRHWAFAATNGQGPSRVVADGKLLFPKPGCFFGDDPFWIGDKLALHEVNFSRVSLTLDGKTIVEGDTEEYLKLIALGDRIGYISGSGVNTPSRLFLEGQLAASIPAPLSSKSLLSYWIMGASEELYYEDEQSMIRRVAFDDSLSLEANDLQNLEARNFAKAHADDLRHPERPWGAHYLKNLLERGRGDLPLAGVQPLLPFLTKDELHGLQAETVGQFAALAQGESWEKLDQIAQFMRAVRTLAKNDEEYNRWVSRWLNIVAADWARAKELLAGLQEVYAVPDAADPVVEYHNAYMDPPSGTSGAFIRAGDGDRAIISTLAGINALKAILTKPADASSRKVQVFQFLASSMDPKQAPGHLRGYLYYLRSEKAELLKEKSVQARAAAPIRDKVENVPLALLTMALRQRAAQVGKPGLTFAEYKKALKSLEHYSPAAVEEEIESAIKGQDSSDLLWVRELIQNPRDALRRAWREGTLPQGQGRIKVESFKRGLDWVVSVEDPVGMTLHKLANYFFPVDASDKQRGVDAGQFGQGLYTLFGDFDEVRIKTGAGDGKTYDIVVIRNNGRLLVKHWEERSENYRGTHIERIKRLNREQPVPIELEAAFVTQSVFEQAGAVQDVDILYQNEKANEKMREVSGLDLGDWGRLRVLESPSRLARITQDELSVSDPGLQAELMALLPDWMRKLWRDKGWTLDLPGKVPLVRSRAGLSQKNEFMPELQKAVMALSVQTAVRLYFEEGLDLGLPQNFYADRAYTSDPGIAADATTLNSGRWPDIDWNRYAKDGEALGQLMASVQVILAGKTISAWQFRREIQEGRNPAAELPVAPTLKGFLNSQAGKAQEDKLSRSRPGKIYTEAEIAATPALRHFRDLNFAFLKLLGEKSGWRIRFYHHEDDVKAHFQNKTISWNLYHTQQLVSQWENILKGKDGFYDFFYEFLETFAHEYTHFSDGNWSHQADETLENGFAWRMRRNIEKLIKAGADIPALVRRHQASQPSP